MRSEEFSTKLQKIDTHKYKLALKSAKCSPAKSFQHLVFHKTEDTLVAIDAKGTGYHLQLIASDWWVKKIGAIGICSAAAYSPIRPGELVIGLAAKGIKLYDINDEANKSSIFRVHKDPPTAISSYQKYCLTASRKEAVIWDMSVARSIHQLRLESNESSIKKALISSKGVVAVLYDNDVLHTWIFKLFSGEHRVDLSEYGVRSVRDFVFTKNGKSLIISGRRRILIFNTKTWEISDWFDLPEGSSGIRRLFVVPQCSNCCCTTISILFDDGRLRFFDFAAKSFIPSDGAVEGIRKAAVSLNGRWLATITLDGSLVILSVDNLIKRKMNPIKLTQKSEVASDLVVNHGVEDHLECVRSEIRRELDRERILPMLRTFKEFPERHRTLIWKTLLRLPENREEYFRLSEAVPLETQVDMLNEWKLADKSLERLLAVTIERLIQFCPLLGQTSFLPELVFPFITAFRKDPVVGFEAVIMVLWNYCQKWFEYHPLPPINVLGIVENILGEIDPALLDFYCKHGVTTAEYAWPLLKTSFSEVLAGKEWMVLWDHFLTAGRPSMLILCVVAYSVCNKEAIMGILEKKEEFAMFFSTQGPISANSIIKMAERIDREVSEKNHPRKYLRDDLKFLPKSGPYPAFLLKEYPKFYIENIGNTKQLMKMKQEELLLKEERRQMERELEENKLREESDNFIQEVHQHRLDEVEKCYIQQWKLTQITLDEEREKLSKLSSENCHSTTSEPSKSRSKVIRTKPRQKPTPYLKLVEDVETLEEEVGTFLDSLKDTR